MLPPPRTVSELEGSGEELSEGEKVCSLTFPGQIGPVAVVLHSVGLDIAAGVGVMQVGEVGSGVKFEARKDKVYARSN